MDFERLIKTTPCAANMAEESSLELATNNTDGHMNVIVHKRDVCATLCLHPNDAKKLRDALIEAYGVGDDVYPKVRYSVEKRYDEQYEVLEATVDEEVRTMAICSDGYDADCLATMLNEAETKEQAAWSAPSVKAAL
jgi:translation initiation factor 2 alpha subunit (eIF-2alpha)